MAEVLEFSQLDYISVRKNMKCEKRDQQKLA